MIITTTPTIDGKHIESYLGIVTGEAIVGVNIFRDIFASIRDIVGGRTQSYEYVLDEARQLAQKDLIDRAAELLQMPLWVWISITKFWARGMAC